MKAFRHSIVIFILFSLVIHFSAMVGLRFSSKTQDISRDKKIEVEIIEAPQKQKRLQVVEQNKTYNNEKPKDAQFLGQHNQKTIKQTRARNLGKFNNQASQGQNGAAQQTQQKKIQQNSLPSLSALVPKIDLKKVARNSTFKQGQQSQTDDHLKDIAVGAQTILNTREFIYYSYFARIKSKIRQHWGNKVRNKVERMVRRGRQIASDQDRITKIIIILDDKGYLVTVKVVGRSGIKDLDDAAIEAFRAAAPFPNPPKGMIETDGKVRINWDFILEANNNSTNKKHRVAKI